LTNDEKLRIDAETAGAQNAKNEPNCPEGLMPHNDMAAEPQRVAHKRRLVKPAKARNNGVIQSRDSDGPQRTTS
jgi:hypothetical protein